MTNVKASGVGPTSRSRRTRLGYLHSGTTALQDPPQCGRRFFDSMEPFSPTSEDLSMHLVGELGKVLQRAPHAHVHDDPGAFGNVPLGRRERPLRFPLQFAGARRIQERCQPTHRPGRAPPQSPRARSSQVELAAGRCLPGPSGMSRQNRTPGEANRAGEHPHRGAGVMPPGRSAPLAWRPPVAARLSARVGVGTAHDRPLLTGRGSHQLHKGNGFAPGMRLSAETTCCSGSA